MNSCDHEGASDSEGQELFQKMLDEADAMSALDDLFGPDADEPDRTMLEAAEKILTGARAMIVLNDPFDDDADERDRISRAVVEKVLTRVRIEKAVMTEDEKLALLISVRTKDYEDKPGDGDENE